MFAPLNRFSARPTRLSTGFFTIRQMPLGAIGFMIALSALYSPADGTAQTPTPQTPPPQAPPAPTRDAEVKASIQRSGLTEAQVRARLQSQGVDSRLVDRYFGDPGTGTTGEASAEFVNALRAAGIIVGPSTPAPADTVRRDTTVARPRARAGFGVFGKDIFSDESQAFDPVAAGPVDALYRINAGDQLQMIITGDVERAYELEIRRDGTVVIPQVGIVPVAGLTLDAARTLLRVRAGQSFGALRDGTARIDLSVSRVRNNVVFVVGEVERPGSYQVSGMATVFHALVQAGGPTDRGSFRDIQLRRGNEVLHVDLYDYLLRGDASRDVRTANGDILFVPLNTRAVAVRGAVRRPAIFELKATETFGDLIEFAGGFLPTASSERVQIDRILPPNERSPGRERVLTDVKFNGNPASLDTVALRDNDIVTAFSIGSLRRNNLQLIGEVYQPGEYEWRPGMTLGDLIGGAQGFLPWALTDRVKIERPVAATGRTEILSIDFRDPGARNLPVQEFDVVTILDGRLAFPGGEVVLTGAVNRPGPKPYAERQTLADLIDLAGGVTEDAASVEVARRRIGATYSDTSSTIYRFAVGPDLLLPETARQFVLERGDAVSVRRSPGFREKQSVQVTGLFAYPGEYTIQNDRERLSSIVRRAGGALPTAFPEAFRLLRDSQVVVIDYERMIRGDRVHDIVPEDGDVITIGDNPGTVVVNGAVVRPATFPYNRSWSLTDYINAAGGLRPDADKNQISVNYASGEVRTISRRLNLARSEPPARPGATIAVAQRDVSKDRNIGDTLTRVAQIATTFLSLVIGYMAVTR